MLASEDHRVSRETSARETRRAGQGRATLCAAALVGSAPGPSRFASTSAHRQISSTPWAQPEIRSRSRSTGCQGDAAATRSACCMSRPRRWPRAYRSSTQTAPPARSQLIEGSTVSAEMNWVGTALDPRARSPPRPIGNPSSTTVTMTAVMHPLRPHSRTAPRATGSYRIARPRGGHRPVSYSVGLRPAPPGATGDEIVQCLGKPIPRAPGPRVIARRGSGLDRRGFSLRTGSRFKPTDDV